MKSSGYNQAKQFVADMIADGVSQESNIHITTFGKKFRNIYNFTQDQTDNQKAIDAVLDKPFQGTGQTQHLYALQYAIDYFTKWKLDPNYDASHLPLFVMISDGMP